MHQEKSEYGVLNYSAACLSYKIFICLVYLARFSDISINLENPEKGKFEGNRRLFFF